MKRFPLAALVTLLSACAETPLPVLSPSPDPSDQASPSAAVPYKSVTAGTVMYKPVEPLPWEEQNQRVNSGMNMPPGTSMPPGMKMSQ